MNSPDLFEAWNDEPMTNGSDDETNSESHNADPAESSLPLSNSCDPKHTDAGNVENSKLYSGKIQDSQNENIEPVGESLRSVRNRKARETRSLKRRIATASVEDEEFPRKRDSTARTPSIASTETCITTQATSLSNATTSQTVIPSNEAHQTPESNDSCSIHADHTKTMVPENTIDGTPTQRVTSSQSQPLIAVASRDGASEQLQSNAISNSSENDGDGFELSIFQTASARPVKVMKASLDKANKRLNCDSRLSEESNCPSLNHQDTNIGVELSNHDVGVFAESSSPILKSNDDDGMELSIFQTASARPVKIAKASMDKASRRLNLDSLISEESNRPALKKTNADVEMELSNHDSTVSPKSSSPSLKSNDDDGMELSIFQTASARPVKIAKASLDKASIRLNRDSLISEESNNPALKNSDADVGMKLSNHDSTVLSKSSGPLLKRNDDDEMEVSIFKTASSRPVKVTKASLDQANKRLHSESPEPPAHTTASANDKVSLFQNGLGDNMYHSQKSLESAERVVNVAQFTTPTSGKLSEPIVRRPKGRAFKTPRSLSKKSHHPEETSCPGSNRKAFVSPQTQTPQQPFVTPCKTKPSPISTSSTFESPRYPREIRNRRLQLADIGPPRPLLRQPVPTWASVSITWRNAHLFLFDALGEPLGLRTGEILPTGALDASEAQRLLLQEPGIKENHISTAWTLNHYRNIVWKLSTQSLKYNHLPFVHKALHLREVVHELVYRYHREVDIAERPVIRKILEHDMFVIAPMVLCVAHIFENGKVVLTDGWYAVESVVDPFLQKKLVVGSKIYLCGASWSGSCTAVAPLEIQVNQIPFESRANAPTLYIHQNCTFPAPWDTKLGLHSRILVKRIKCLSNIPNSFVSKIHCRVIRTFDTLYGEQVNDKWCFRTQKEFQGKQACDDTYQTDSARGKQVRAVTIVLLEDVHVSGGQVELSIWKSSDESSEQTDFRPGMTFLLSYPSVVKRCWISCSKLGLGFGKYTRLKRTTQGMSPKSKSSINRMPVPFPPAGDGWNVLVDTAGIFLRTWGTHALFCSSGANTILALDIGTLHFESYKFGDIMLLRDIIYLRFDSDRHWVVASTTQVSTVSKKDAGKRGWKHLDEMHSQLVSWLSSKGMDRLNAILSALKIDSDEDAVEEAPMSQNTKCQIEKNKQEAIRRRSMSSKRKGGESSFTAPIIPNADLTSIQLGRKTIQLYTSKSDIAKTRPNNCVKFSDGYLNQHVKVLAWVPYEGVSSVIENVDYRLISPMAKSADEVRESLLKLFPADERLYGMHFCCLESGHE